MISRGALASMPPICNVMTPFVPGHGAWNSKDILPITSVVGKGELENSRSDGKPVNVNEPMGTFGRNPVPVIKMVSAAKASDIDRVMAALGTK